MSTVRKGSDPRDAQLSADRLGSLSTRRVGASLQVGGEVDCASRFGYPAFVRSDGYVHASALGTRTLVRMSIRIRG